MSNAKIISIIDHENTILRTDMMHAIARIVQEANAPIVQKLEQLQRRIEKLEEGVSLKLSG